MPAQSSPRRVRYREIADSLRREIREGHLSAGSVLPSEATLSAAHGASRVTIRKALELLRDEGLLSSRQGAGWFVSVRPLQQSLGRLGTLEEQLEASKRSSEREVLDFAFGAAPQWVTDVLGSQEVLIVRRRNLADGVPFARVTVWCPEPLGRHVTRAQVEAAPFYEVLGVGLGGATQTIAAVAMERGDAAVLDVPEGSPALRCTRVTTDQMGRPVLVSEHVFPAHLTEFVVEIPEVEPSLAPDGLRIVASVPDR
jgi:GntR family transcriptional regulator